MERIVECIPNFSEGRRKEVIDEIVGEVKKVKGVKLLDVESDVDHNRSVVTFIGEPKAVLEAAFLAAKKASELIDMNKHKGEHPRIGATDVIPFVPISNVTMEECVELAKKLGKRIADELKIPVYLYEAAATKPERVNLADIRKGEYEGLKKEIETNPERKPDYGAAKLHPTAGATVVGAREPLIAFNVNLGTSNIEIAKKIAKAVRFSSGGFKNVKAKGFDIKNRGIVQVSMNLTNYKETPIFRVFEMVKREAERYGVPVIGSEIVGLVPLDALVDVSDFYLQLENFKKTQILETRLWE
ncbi:MAG: glutamate formimidoyltransferase [Candidatus Micrarchaeia archaeon]